MVPQELTAFNQWVLWREVIRPDGERTKLPYSVSGNLASVTDSRTWTSYANAVQAAQRLQMGIGFVLTANDPYAFIDLDDPYKNTKPDEVTPIIESHQKILSSFDTYTEVSPSGKGLHLIVKGAVDKGRRRNKVEIYSSERYMTITGNTLFDKPIQDRGFLLQQLWQECGNGNGHGEVIVEERAEQHTDKEIYDTAINAENGEKFAQLWQGHWMEAGYQSQSEADFAIINILSFYSRNVMQIKRMFFMCGLGQRDKAKRKTYVDNMIKRSFDNQPVMLPLDQLTSKLAEQIKQKEEPSNPFVGPLFQNVPDTEDAWTVPDGLLGDIAQFIYNAAPRPVKEIALAGAIGLMAGICGRQYNISATGLNQYILVLAGTGTGKEAIASGMDKLMRYVRMKVPAAQQFIGPAEIASGQALIRYISKVPCFVSVVGEFGLALQYLCAYNANTAQIMLRKKLLELYNKSGEKDVMQPTVYSDKDKNTQAVQSPAFTLLGESTPESYFTGLDETMIAQGLLPRFLTIEYDGPRPALNESHASVEPSAQLIDHVAELATNCLMLQQSHRVFHVQLNSEAQKIANDFEKQTTDRINKAEISVTKELWNRAHLKMLKLSALIAIGINPYEAVVTAECVEWAKQLVERDIVKIFHRFEQGKIGRETGERHQWDTLTKIIADYLLRPFDATMQRYMVDPRMHQDRVIALAFLQRKASSNAAFKNDRMGSTFAIKRTIDSFVSDGALQEVRQLDMNSRYGKAVKAYMVTDLTRFTG